MFFLNDVFNGFYYSVFWLNFQGCKSALSKFSNGTDIFHRKAVVVLEFQVKGRIASFLRQHRDLSPNNSYSSSFNFSIILKKKFFLLIFCVLDKKFRWWKSTLSAKTNCRIHNNLVPFPKINKNSTEHIFFITFMRNLFLSVILNPKCLYGFVFNTIFPWTQRYILIKWKIRVYKGIYD